MRRATIRESVPDGLSTVEVNALEANELLRKVAVALDQVVNRTEAAVKAGRGVIPGEIADVNRESMNYAASHVRLLRAAVETGEEMMAQVSAQQAEVGRLSRAIREARNRGGALTEDSPLAAEAHSLGIAVAPSPPAHDPRTDIPISGDPTAWSLPPAPTMLPVPPPQDAPPAAGPIPPGGTPPPQDPGDGRDIPPGGTPPPQDQPPAPTMIPPEPTVSEANALAALTPAFSLRAEGDIVGTSPLQDPKTVPLSAPPVGAAPTEARADAGRTEGEASETGRPVGDLAGQAGGDGGRGARRRARTRPPGDNHGDAGADARPADAGGPEQPSGDQGGGRPD